MGVRRGGEEELKDPGLFRIPRVRVEELRAWGDALERAVAGKGIDGLIVEQALPGALARAVSDAVDAGDPKLPRFTKSGEAGPDGPAWAAGPLIHNTAEGIERYLTLSMLFRLHMQYLFDKYTGMGLEERVESLLRALGGGREVILPTSPEGTYMPANLRTMTAGTDLPLHCGNQFSRFPSYAHLNSIVETHDQFSWFFQIAKPEEGGELILYEHQWQGDPSFRPEDLDDYATQGTEGQRWMPVPLEEGDLLMFAGGRIYHRVTEVVGRKVRRTCGGFGTFGADRSQIVYWG